MYNEYSLGKTPLHVRVARYLDRYGIPDDGLVPIHPDEFFSDKPGIQKALKDAEDLNGVKCFPLGMREVFSG